MTATTAKTVNYTPEQESQMKLEYVASPTPQTVAKLAAMFGKTTRSVIAKLARLEVYQKPETESKSDSGAKKAELAKAIGLVLQMSEPEYESLEKAGKQALEKIFKALANSKPLE